MRRLATYLLPDFREKTDALKRKETWAWLLAGILLVLGHLLPGLGFLTYAAFFGLSLLFYRGKATAAALFYFWFPYFLVLGLGVWDHVFPRPLGAVLAVALAFPVSRLFLDAGRLAPGGPALALFLFDLATRKLPYVAAAQFPPLLSPLAAYPVLLSPARVFGRHLTLLLAALLLDAAAAVLSGIRRRRATALLAASLALLVPAGIFSFQAPGGDEVTAAAVQGSLSSASSGLGGLERYEFLLENYTRLVEDTGAGVILFPEIPLGVLDRDGLIDGDFRRAFKDLAAEKDALVGLLVIEGSSVTKSKEDRHLTVLLVEPGGIAGLSRKRSLVPFSEASRYTPGESYEAHDTRIGKVGVSVCYDTDRGAIGRLARAGAELILAPYNDNGFGILFHNIHRFGPVIGAVETGLPVIQANENGISQIVDANGRILARAGIDETAVLTASVAKGAGQSPYIRFGNLLEVPAALAALFLLSRRFGSKGLPGTRG